MSKNPYVAFKEKRQAEVDAFPMIFAFSLSQLYEGMRKLGLQPVQTNDLLEIGGGGYIKKSDRDKYIALGNKHEKEFADAIAKDTTGEGFIYHMFRYELANHEFGYTRDIEDTLNALGMTSAVIQRSPNLKNGLELAIQSILKEEQ